MLGWQFFIQIRGDEARNPKDGKGSLLATWEAGLGGTDWIEQLVVQGKAKDLGGNGYPNRYTVTAMTLKNALAGGLPRHGGPPTIGENYFLPTGWTGSARLDLARLNELDPTCLLEVEAWDQS